MQSQQKQKQRNKEERVKEALRVAKYRKAKKESGDGEVNKIPNSWVISRVFHITPFFELSLVLLTIHAIGLYEVKKKFQRYRQ